MSGLHSGLTRCFLAMVGHVLSMAQNSQKFHFLKLCTLQ